MPKTLYQIADGVPPARVVLLGRLESAIPVDSSDTGPDPFIEAGRALRERYPPLTPEEPEEPEAAPEDPTTTPGDP